MQDISLFSSYQVGDSVCLFPESFRKQSQPEEARPAEIFISGFEQITVGQVWKGDADQHCMQAVCKKWSLRQGMAQPCWQVSFLAATGPGRLTRVEKNGLSLAWITLSDKGVRGEREDTSGPGIAECLRTEIPLCLTRGHVIADEKKQLLPLLTDLALFQGFDLIFTTGGTGVSPRDITPETTALVLEKRLPGFEIAMMNASLRKTPHAAVSRAVCGILGQSLIINLPGSLKAVRENVQAILPALVHTVAKAHGDEHDCGVPVPASTKIT